MSFKNMKVCISSTQRLLFNHLFSINPVPSFYVSAVTLVVFYGKSKSQKVAAPMQARQRQETGTSL